MIWLVRPFRTILGSRELEFVRNAWYVAGWSSEFSGDLQSLQILDEKLVFWRRPDGDLAALEDRCPHRMLPLSMGKLLEDGNLQCGYHGLTFAADGACVRIPGQDNLPASACVRAYPVVERHHIVWVWMGDPEQADEAQIFDMPEFNAPGWAAHQGEALHIEANYLNVAENLVDPAHVSFVHPTTLGSSASEDVPVKADVSGEVITAWRWIRNAPPVGFFREFAGLEGMVDRWHYYHLHLPSIAVIDFGSAPSDLGLSEEEREKGVRIYALHFLTPVGPHHTIDRWMHIRNSALDNPQAAEKMDALFRFAFAEDKEILEAVEKNEAGASAAPLRIAIDRGPLVYRKRIAERIAAEQAG